MNNFRTWLASRKINTVDDAAKYLLRRAVQVLVASFFVVFLLFLLSTLANVLASVPWLGFGPYINAQGEIEPAKTLWNWLELLIVPLILAIGGVAINSTIQRSERERADKQRQTELEIADDRLKEQSLQTYLDRMTELLLEKGLGKPDVSEEVRTVARVRTLTMLSHLNGTRKGVLLRFLYEAELLAHTQPIVSLAGADLTDAYLSVIDLAGANLCGAKLMRANLIGAQLTGANLIGANLAGANLTLAQLKDADLGGAVLHPVPDRNGKLIPHANLAGTNLTGANLKAVGLHNVILTGASLTGAKVSRERLITAILNEDTTLPDGSKYDPDKGLPPAWDIDDPSKPAK